MKKLSLFLLIFLLCRVAHAQYQGIVYLPDTAATLMDGNAEKTMGFGGGFNNPQFAMGDLNNDGRNDLVVFERGCEWVRTFINYGTPGMPDYRYRPQYADNFPPVEVFLKLLDYNCDHIPDLIHRGSTGFSVYKGYYNADNELAFQFYKDLFYSPLLSAQEGFESAAFPPSEWHISNHGWTRETVGVNPTCMPHSQTAMAAFNSMNIPSGASVLLVSKRLRISPQLGARASVSFWIYRDAASQSDSLSVYMDTDTLLTANATFLGSVARCRTLNLPDVKNADGWYQYSFNIPAPVVGDTLFLIFKATSGGGNTIFIDDVEWISSNTVGDVNAFVEHSDIPAVADVDNDGDLDFLSYSAAGAYIDWYKNYQVEDGLPCDSIHINLKDVCWGKVYQAVERTQYLGISCTQPIDPGKPTKTTHAGNTLCLTDMDGDGDYDYFNSNAIFPDIQFFQNGRIEYNTNIDSMIAQDTLWQSNGTVLSINEWPAAFWLDIDDDGDHDLVFSPQTEGASENKWCIKWYKNINNDISPNYQAQNDSLFTGSALDVGSVSYPMLYDYNKDGKPDLFVGGEGEYSPGASLRARMEYYENTTAGGSISFKKITGDFLNLYAQNTVCAAPAVGDLDNDGKDDLVIGHADGTLSFYSNTAANNNVQPVWQLSQTILKDQNNVDIDAGNSAAPFIYDMDKDGKMDLLIGNQTGRIIFYKNSGTVGQPRLQHQTNQLGNVKVNGTNTTSAFSTPYIGRIDNEPKDYLVTGSYSGKLYKYTGFQSGNVSNPFQVLDSVYSLINAGMNNYSGYRSAPAFADVDNDGKYEMVLGNGLGGVTLYKQYRNVNESVKINEFNYLSSAVVFYPNPVKDHKLHIFFENCCEKNGNVRAELFSVNGTKLLNQSLHFENNRSTLFLNELQPGVYFLRVLWHDGVAVRKISVE